MRLIVWAVALGMLTAASASSSSYALEAEAQGRYVVLHRDGQETDMIFRLRSGEGWRLEEQLKQGAWRDVTCSRDCALRESTPADIERFFNKSAELLESQPACVHNMAFAFCSYSGAASEDPRRYVVIVLLQSRPIQVSLRRLPNEP